MVMTITFERPVGAHLDVKELEYVNALHQTGNKLRDDASLTGTFGFALHSFLCRLGPHSHYFLSS